MKENQREYDREKFPSPLKGDTGFRILKRPTHYKAHTLVVKPIQPWERKRNSSKNSLKSPRPVSEVEIRDIMVELWN